MNYFLLKIEMSRFCFLREQTEFAVDSSAQGFPTPTVFWNDDDARKPIEKQIQTNVEMVRDA